MNSQHAVAVKPGNCIHSISPSRGSQRSWCSIWSGSQKTQYELACSQHLWNFPLRDKDLREFASENTKNAIYNLYCVQLLRVLHGLPLNVLLPESNDRKMAQFQWLQCHTHVLQPYVHQWCLFALLLISQSILHVAETSYIPFSLPCGGAPP